PNGPALSAIGLVEELVNRLQDGGGDVEDFIAAHPGHAETLRRMLPAVRVMADLSRSTDATDFPHGDSGAPLGELGDYRIIREVGRGGMGIGYEAGTVSLCRPGSSAREPLVGAVAA